MLKGSQRKRGIRADRSVRRDSANRGGGNRLCCFKQRPFCSCSIRSYPWFPLLSFQHERRSQPLWSPPACLDDGGHCRRDSRRQSERSRAINHPPVTICRCAGLGSFTLNHHRDRGFLEKPNARSASQERAKLLDRCVDQAKLGRTRDGPRRLARIPDAREQHRFAALGREGAPGAPKSPRVILEEAFDAGRTAGGSAPR